MPNIQSLQSNKHIASYVARAAIKALYYELALYPKPGLVSFIDNGAHADMNGQMLFKSLFSLRHYFYRISLLAIENKPLVEQVRLGIQAERKMLAVTHGVNTHRGAIFSLGIFCSCVAKRLSDKNKLTPITIQTELINYWSEHLLKKHHMITNTHGAVVKRKFNIGGAKEMAISGYQLVFDTYRELIDSQVNNTIFGLRGYCLLLSKMEDTNIIHRCGLSGLKYAKDQINCTFCLENENLVVKMLDIHHSFCIKNISPGGVADMIGVLYFLKLILGDRV